MVSLWDLKPAFLAELEGKYEFKWYPYGIWNITKELNSTSFSYLNGIPMGFET